jgi:hypothetical protein
MNINLTINDINDEKISQELDSTLSLLFSISKIYLFLHKIL